MVVMALVRDADELRPGDKVDVGTRLVHGRGCLVRWKMRDKKTEDVNEQNAREKENKTHPGVFIQNNTG